MNQYLIVSKVDRLEEHLELANEYGVGFEVNDFFIPAVLDDEKQQQEIINQYLNAGMPKGSTLHGAFFDVTVFSSDEKIRETSKLRMKQSMEIARQLGSCGVVFHVNSNPFLSGDPYDTSVVEQTVSYVEELLQEYSGISIYLENMFETEPHLLVRISEKLMQYENYGVCLDYAHASISNTPIQEWVEALAPYVKHIHINDNNLHQDLHLALGEGRIDWKLFLEYVETYFQDCSILIETTLPENQRKSLEYLQQKQYEKAEQAGKVFLREPQPEEMLEKIFYYMNRMVDEKGFASTIVLLTDMGRTLANSERASFWYWDVRKKQYWTLAALGRDRIIVPEGSGIVGASIQNNEIILINNPYADARFNSQIDKESGFVTKSILCIPVTDTKGEVIGAFQAINKLDENGESDFNERDVKRLTMAAVHCGKALESYLLYHETQVDQLTGLKNRRGFYEYYSDYIQPHLQKQKASAIICDIDFFKKVNDTYGHNGGDAVLAQIASILQTSVGEAGEAVRWGGEEFVLLLLDYDLEQAAKLAEQIRQTIEQSVCPYEGREIKVTMSFGVKEIDAVCSAERNIEQADEKLYEAKATGRNRVVF